VSILNAKGYSLVEIIITMGLTAFVVTGVSIAMFRFRDNVEYDIVLNKIVESVNFAKTKAMNSRLDSSEQRIPYSVKFFGNRIVEFEGDVYIEGADTNVEHEIPVGLKLTSSCNPEDNGEVMFSPIKGENSNNCTIYIYKFEQPTPTGSVVIGKYGVSQAS
jgi:hypothetical protein